MVGEEAYIAGDMKGQGLTTISEIISVVSSLIILLKAMK